jgi:uncharacterized repeat protein (TIGR01451 family)
MTTVLAHRVRTILGIVLLTALLVSLVPAQPTRAAGSWYVATTGDDGNSCQSPSAPCATIQAAVDKAGSGDTIYVTVGTYTSNSLYSVVYLQYTQNLIISGGWNNQFSGQEGMSTIDGQNSRNGIDSSGIVTLENLIVQNGFFLVSASGSGVKNDHGIMTINHSIIRNNNSTNWAGGINNFGTLTINDTSILNNDAIAGGSALLNYDGNVTINNSSIYSNSLINGETTIENMATLHINNSTISGNGKVNTYISSVIYNTSHVEINSSTIANNIGRGLSNSGYSVIQNSILANNTDRDCYQESGYSGGVTSLGYNIIENNFNCILIGLDKYQIDPLLGTLQDNGGPTYTMALLDGSPAVEGGNPAGCLGSDGELRTDQRGFSRLRSCDIGAYEFQWDIYASMEVTPTSASPGDLITYTIKIQNGSSSVINNVSLMDPLPSSLSYQDNSLINSSGASEYGSGTITWNGSIEPKGEVTITFGADIAASALRGTQIINAATIEGAGKILSPSAKIDLPLVNVFLPLIVRPETGISGHVSLNGSSVATNVSLLLFDGNSWNVIDVANTDYNGNFMFVPPPLQAGQAYCVRWTNWWITEGYGYNGQISVWFTRIATTYNSDQILHIGDFDIADVPLLSPAAGSTVSLPMTFQWTKRPATQNDSYQFELFDPGGPSDFITPLLGYVNSYTLNQLPDGFVTSKTYGWTLLVNTSDGGYGLVYYYNPVIFFNHGSAQTLFVRPQPNRIQLQDLLVPRWIP